MKKNGLHLHMQQNSTKDASWVQALQCFTNLLKKGRKLIFKLAHTGTTDEVPLTITYHQTELRI